jgi:small subunit ribosomal protein S3
VTDDSAFKKQIRARMAETGEKYTEARRSVIADVTEQQLRVEAEAAEDASIRGALHRSLERAIGLSELKIERTKDRVRVDIRSTRPGLLIGHRGAEADRLRGELEELTGKRVGLYLWQVPSQQELESDDPDNAAWRGA